MEHAIVYIVMKNECLLLQRVGEPFCIIRYQAVEVGGHPSSLAAWPASHMIVVCTRREVSVFVDFIFNLSGGYVLLHHTG